MLAKPAGGPYSGAMRLTELRIGHGYDLHRLEPLPPEGAGRPFVLAGIPFDHDRGPVGHSDGDAVAHAVTDALMGAIAGPDIGELFPDTDDAWRNADSMPFIARAMELVRASGRCVVNLDVTVICERPRIAPHKAAMIDALATVMGVDRNQVNVKGKTHEKVDAVGEGRAIEVHAVVLLAPGSD
ncbi:MAG: 2-C-methyl-D-erythritol 2,4-cyclodiphosphate synthase [Phycisphaerales bacterium]|nr:2-C-methyl-D-erythritol 2,4-cyclodiphosphate synthase [Phycisphaerales bacterium]